MVDRFSVVSGCRMVDRFSVVSGYRMVDRFSVVSGCRMVECFAAPGMIPRPDFVPAFLLSAIRSV